MNEMDVCVPAFAEYGYYRMQASSTFAMAIQCDVCDDVTLTIQAIHSLFLTQVPILVTQRTRQSYVYADDDRAVITRPAAMREVAALKALRVRDASSFLETTMPNMPEHKKLGSNTVIRNAVQSMMDRGWTRKKSEMEAFKSSLWERNDRLAERILRDL
jgi:hypothetical protein